MDVLTFRPYVGLFRVVERGNPTFYYRINTGDWTTNPDRASLMPRDLAESIKAKYSHNAKVDIEFVVSAEIEFVSSNLINKEN